MPRFQSSKFVTTDEFAADLAAATGAVGLEIDGPDEGFLCETDAIQVGGAVVIKQSLGAGLQVECVSEEDTYTFFFTIAGTTAFEFDRHDAHLGVGDGFVNNDQRRHVLRTSEGTRLVIGIDRALMRGVLAEHFGKTSKSNLLFATKFDGHRGGGQVVQHMANALLSCDSHTRAADRTQRRVLDALVLQIIEGLPHDHGQLLEDDGHSLMPRQVKRAQELMEEFALDNLSIIEIAERLNLSARSLQYAFIRHCGMTPVSYYRLVRLRRAVAELAAFDERPVRGVALKWGFTNIGRFSALCQEEFGKRPHEFSRSSIG